MGINVHTLVGICVVAIQTFRLLRHLGLGRAMLCFTMLCKLSPELCPGYPDLLSVGGSRVSWKLSRAVGEGFNPAFEVFIVVNSKVIPGKGVDWECCLGMGNTLQDVSFKQ